MKLLSRTEELIMLVVWNLQDGAYSLSVMERMGEILGHEPNVGTVYVPLERLAKRGLLLTREGPATDRPGGRRTRFYRLSASGAQALVQVERAREGARQNADPRRIQAALDRSILS